MALPTIGASTRGTESESLENEARNKRKRKRDSQSATEGVGPRKYACPFKVRNPARSPCTKGYINVSRVKEHIRRRHLPSIFCPRCCLVFQTPHERWKHARSATPCKLSSVTPVGDGNTISKEAHDELNRRTKTGDDPEGSWLQIFKIIFPDVSDDNLPSPFMDDLERPSRSRTPELDDSHKSSGRAYSLRVQQRLMDVANTIHPGMQIELLLDLERTVQKYECKEGQSSDDTGYPREIAFFPSGRCDDIWNCIDGESTSTSSLEPSSVSGMTDNFAIGGVHDSTSNLISEVNSSVQFESPVGLISGPFFDINNDLISPGYYGENYSEPFSTLSTDYRPYQSSISTLPPSEIPTAFFRPDVSRSKGYGIYLPRIQEFSNQIEFSLSHLL